MVNQNLLCYFPFIYKLKCPCFKNGDNGSTFYLKLGVFGHLDIQIFRYLYIFSGHVSLLIAKSEAHKVPQNDYIMHNKCSRKDTCIK